MFSFVFGREFCSLKSYFEVEGLQNVCVSRNLASSSSSSSSSFFLVQAAATEAHCHFCLALFAAYELHLYLYASGGIEFACKCTRRLLLAIT